MYREYFTSAFVFYMGLVRKVYTGRCKACQESLYWAVRCLLGKLVLTEYRFAMLVRIVSFGAYF